MYKLLIPRMLTLCDIGYPLIYRNTCTYNFHEVSHVIQNTILDQ